MSIEIDINKKDETWQNKKKISESINFLDDQGLLKTQKNDY